MIRNEKLARLVRRETARKKDNPAVKAEIRVYFADDSETIMTLYLGKTSANARDCEGIKKDADARKKILASAPSKESKCWSMKKILSEAKLGNNPWNRNKLWDLVEEGELVALRDGFRKAK